MCQLFPPSFELRRIHVYFMHPFIFQYINFMSAIDKEKTSKIFRRACMIHLVKKPYIHLNWAAFEEERGNPCLKFTGDSDGILEL